MTVVDVVVVLVAFAPMLASRDLRARRSIFFTLVLVGAYVVSGWLSQPLQVVVRVAVVWIYILVFLRFQYWLAGRSSAEARFDRELRRLAKESRDLQGPRTNEWRDAGKAILARIDLLNPPNAHWQEVHSLFRSYHRDILGDEMSVDESGEQAARTSRIEVHRRELEKAWEAALRPQARLDSQGPAIER